MDKPKTSLRGSLWALLVLMVAPVWGDTFSVTVANDSGDGSVPGSLSWAIWQANLSGSPSTVVLSTNVLLEGPMRVFIDSDMEIRSDSTRRSIDGNQSYRPLFVRSGQVMLRDVDVINGRAIGGASAGAGGGAGLGGALFILDGAVEVRNVNFVGNAAHGGRGGSSGVGGGAGMFGDALGEGGGGLFDASVGVVGDGAGNNGGVFAALTPGGEGGFGSGGGSSIFNDGGHGGFGAGGGNGVNGGDGGFGGGGGSGRGGESTLTTLNGQGGAGGFGAGGGHGAFEPGPGGWGGSAGGGHGAGLGGAIFVHAGTLDLYQSTFSDNQVVAGGEGATAVGADLFICTGDLDASAVSCNGSARADEPSSVSSVFGTLVAMPSQLAITAQPSITAVSGVPFVEQPVIQLLDVSGNAVSEENIAVTAAITAPGADALLGTLTAFTNASGVAAFTDLVIAGLVGVRTLTFTAPGLTAATSNNIAITAGAASELKKITLGDGQKGAVNSTLSVSPQVQVEDEFGNVVAGATVAFTASGTSTVSAASVETDINGLASVDWTLGTTAGAYTLTAAVGELDAVQFTATAEAVAATAPTLTSLTPGNGKISVAFIGPTDTGGSAISNYQYQLDGGDWVAFAPATTTSPAVISSLTNGQSYSVALRAITAAGAGASSNALSATPVTLPGAPTAVTAERGNSQVTIGWTAPTETGGSAIIGYTVTGDPSGSCMVAADVTQCTISGLTNGTAYTFSVVATNAVGNSPVSVSDPATPVGPPSEALNIDVQAVVGGLLVSWTAPLDDGGSPITKYVARANPSCEVPAVPNEIPGETRYLCAIIGLSGSASYQVGVAVVTAAGFENDVMVSPADIGGGDSEGFAPLPEPAMETPTVPVPVNQLAFLLLLGLLMLSLGVFHLRRKFY